MANPYLKFHGKSCTVRFKVLKDTEETRSGLVQVEEKCIRVGGMTIDNHFILEVSDEGGTP